MWSVFKMSDTLPRTLLWSVRKTRGRQLPDVLFIVVVSARHPNLVRDEALRTVQPWSRRLMASMEALALVTKRYSRSSPSRFGFAECRSGCNLHRIHDHTQHPLQHRAECDELRLELIRRRCTGTFCQRHLRDMSPRHHYSRRAARRVARRCPSRHGRF